MIFSLIHINYDELAGFMYTFWKKRDFNNAGFEWEKYNDKVIEAEKAFGIRGIPGYKSDRGKFKITTASSVNAYLFLTKIEFKMINTYQFYPTSLLLYHFQYQNHPDADHLVYLQLY